MAHVTTTLALPIGRCPGGHIPMDDIPKYRFDPVDHNFMRIRGRLSPGERLQAMLAAREWVFAAHRARLQRLNPDLSPVEINLRVLEEIERAERRQARPDAVS